VPTLATLTQGDSSMRFNSITSLALTLLLAGCANSPPPVAVDIEGPSVDVTEFTQSSPGAATVRVSDSTVAIFGADGVSLTGGLIEGAAVYRQIYLAPGYHCVGYGFSDESISNSEIPRVTIPMVVGCFDARRGRDYTIAPAKFFKNFLVTQIEEWPKIIDTASGEVVLGRGTGEIPEDSPKARAVVSLIGPNEEPFLPSILQVSNILHLSQGGHPATRLNSHLRKQREYEIAAGNLNVMVGTALGLHSVDLDLTPGQFVRLAVGQKGLYVIDESNYRVIRRPS
jgi:hypothetical protein